MPKYCLFIDLLLDYILRPNLTGVQGKRESKKNQQKNRQLAASSVERINRRHSMASLEKQKEKIKTKENTNDNNTSSKYREDNCIYKWFETTG